MADEPTKSQSIENAAVQRLAKETGITEAQASELVAFLGPNNWPSLLREARIIAALKPWSK